MSHLRRRSVAMPTLLIILVSTAVMFVPATSQAQFNDEVDHYYNDCGAGRYLVGEEHYDCDGNLVSSWGTTSDYYEIVLTNCGTHAVQHIYVECATPVSSLDTCIC